MKKALIIIILLGLILGSIGSVSAEVPYVIEVKPNKILVMTINDSTHQYSYDDNSYTYSGLYLTGNETKQIYRINDVVYNKEMLFLSKNGLHYAVTNTKPYNMRASSNLNNIVINFYNRGIKNTSYTLNELHIKAEDILLSTRKLDWYKEAYSKGNYLFIKTLSEQTLIFNIRTGRITNRIGYLFNRVTPYLLILLSCIIICVFFLVRRKNNDNSKKHN